VLAEIRIESLGAIRAATAQFDCGLTVLTGETGAGKTMVVTGLHLVGGSRADPTKVRSGADRAVVEGRFVTTELSDRLTTQVDEMLDSSGAERDDDGSVIAARSVNRDGPSRAYLGGRSVPAKSLSGFTSELLTLHGQNDQLRCPSIYPSEQTSIITYSSSFFSYIKSSYFLARCSRITPNIFNSLIFCLSRNCRHLHGFIFDRAYLEIVENSFLSKWQRSCIT